MNVINSVFLSSAPVEALIKIDAFAGPINFEGCQMYANTHQMPLWWRFKVAAKIFWFVLRSPVNGRGDL